MARKETKPIRKFLSLVLRQRHTGLESTWIARDAPVLNLACSLELIHQAVMTSLPRLALLRFGRVVNET